MRTLPVLPFVALLSAGLVGCGGTDTTPSTSQPRVLDNAVGTTGSAEPAAPGELPNQASERESELPSTASPLALWGLLGLASVAGALGVRRLRRA